MRQEFEVKNRISWLQARCETQSKQKNDDEGIWYRIQEMRWVLESHKVIQNELERN